MIKDIYVKNNIFKKKKVKFMNLGLLKIIVETMLWKQIQTRPKSHLKIK